MFRLRIADSPQLAAGSFTHRPCLMDTDEEPLGVSLSSETETGHVGGGAICIVVVIIKPDMDLLLFIGSDSVQYRQ
jgi:hypothetical protein